MDPVTITLIIGIGTLLVERLYNILSKTKKSSCCGGNIEFSENEKLILK